VGGTLIDVQRVKEIRLSHTTHIESNSQFNFAKLLPIRPSKHARAHINILLVVISVGPGREEENGMIAPMPDISIGDIVIAKNPWGIGPKDEETADGKKLSFMRSQDIAAVVTGGIEEFEQDDGQYL
jgi:co-chaperonin GroES (HSP10)